MNYRIAGASMHQTYQMRARKSVHEQIVDGLNLPSVLSKLELRQLVAAMID